jgi:cytidylate kinase
MLQQNLDLSPFPNGVGQLLDYQPFNSKNKKQLDTKTIIRIYGVVGAGKGTLANLLVDELDLINLETSNILRAGTWIYENLGLEFNNKNTDQVFEQIEIKLNDQNLEFFWNDERLTKAELRSEIVDQKVSMYSGDPYYRLKYYERINFILDNLIKKPVILDGRGSNTPYLNNAEESGFKVYRLFLWVNKEKAFERFLARKEITLNEENKNELQAEFEKVVIERDLKDYKNILSNNLGTISSDTGIIDTSDLEPNQVLETALNFIYSN